MVCGSPLDYLDQTEEMVCTFCGKQEQGNIKCPRGHFVCDTCHNKDAVKIIEDIALTTELTDPFAIADLMMDNPDLPMLGCQHAHLAGGALMAALKNHRPEKITAQSVKEVFSRIDKQALGGYCGLTGVCGIAPAIGACFAVLTGSRCGKDREQKLVMEAVTRVSRVITDLTGPSCCKAYLWAALSVAVADLKENFAIELPDRDGILCSYSRKHPHGCREDKCPYFKPGSGGSSGDETNLSGKVGGLLKRAVELGAEQAKIIDTKTVIVAEWVWWKCQYGCPFYEKDAIHPPVSPDAERAKKVMKEYKTAILLTSAKGRELTDVAVNLEREAYHEGFYKAFALTALSPGSSGAT